MGFVDFLLSLMEEAFCSIQIQIVACMCSQTPHGLSCPSLTWLSHTGLELVSSAQHISICEKMMNRACILGLKSQQ